MTTIELKDLLDRRLSRRRESSNEGTAFPSAIPAQQARPEDLLVRAVTVLEGQLKEELEFLQVLRNADAEWHAKITSGELKQDPDFARLLTSCYQNWEASARQRLRQLEIVEAKGNSVCCGAAFRHALEEVQSILEERSWTELGRRARARFVEED